MLACNHPCRLLCHPFSHEDVVCDLLCQKELMCGHPCELRCSQECDCSCEAFQTQKDGHTIIPDGKTWADYVQQSSVVPARDVRRQVLPNSGDLGATRQRESTRTGPSSRTTWTRQYPTLQPPVQGIANMNLNGGSSEPSSHHGQLYDKQSPVPPRLKNGQDIHRRPQADVDNEWYDPEMEERMKQLSQQDDYW